MKHPRNKRERAKIGYHKSMKIHRGYLDEIDEKWRPRAFGLAKNTRTLCSNPFCCGNSRRIRGSNVFTVQEKRNKLKMDYRDD